MLFCFVSLCFDLTVIFVGLVGNGLLRSFTTDANSNATNKNENEWENDPTVIELAQSGERDRLEIVLKGKYPSLNEIAVIETASKLIAANKTGATEQGKFSFCVFLCFSFSYCLTNFRAIS